MPEWKDGKQGDVCVSCKKNAGHEVAGVKKDGSVAFWCSACVDKQLASHTSLKEARLNWKKVSSACTSPLNAF